MGIAFPSHQSQNQAFRAQIKQDIPHTHIHTPFQLSLIFTRGNIQNIIPSNTEWLLGVTRSCGKTSEWNFISNKQETNEEGRIKKLFFFAIYIMISYVCVYIYMYFFNYCWDVRKQRKRTDNVALLVTEQNVMVSSTS